MSIEKAGMIWNIGKVIVLVFLLILSVIDSKTRLIPRKILWIWSALGIIYLMALWNCGKLDWLNTCMGVGTGVLFLGVSRITDEAIGYGDSVVIIILGVFLGFWKLAETLAGAFLISGICAIVLVSTRRVRTMPFLPFLTLGYLVVLAEQGGAL